MFRRDVSAVFRGSVSGQGWKCFGTVFQQFRQHIWEGVSGMCFGAVFRDVLRDADTRPQNPKVASGDQISFETPFETHPFQSPAIFFFLLGRGRVHLPQWAGCPRRSGGTPPPPPPDELNSNPAEPAAAWAS